MTPGPSKDVWPYSSTLAITISDIRPHVKWTVSLVIADYHLISLRGVYGYAWVQGLVDRVGQAWKVHDKTCDDTHPKTTRLRINVTVLTTFTRQGLLVMTFTVYVHMTLKLFTGVMSMCFTNALCIIIIIHIMCTCVSVRAAERTKPSFLVLPDPFSFSVMTKIHLTLKVLVATIDALGHFGNKIITAQCEGMGEVGSARYEPALLPPCPSIRVLSYSNCQRSTHSMSKWMFRNLAL